MSQPWKKIMLGAIMMGWGLTLFIIGRIAFDRNDRELLRARRARAMALGPATFLLQRAADDLAERLATVLRRFDLAVEGTRKEIDLSQTPCMLAKLAFPRAKRGRPVPERPLFISCRNASSGRFPLPPLHRLDKTQG